MKKLALLLTLFSFLSTYSQTSELISVLTKEARKSCVDGDYKKFEKYCKKIGQEKEQFKTYSLYVSKQKDDFNYIIKGVKSEADYYKKIYFALEEILNPNIHVEYYVYKKYTALTQYHDDGTTVGVFIFADAPRN